MRTVVFDLDGTLADTAADFIAAGNACLRRLGEDAVFDPVADAGTAFHGGRALLRLGFSRLGTASEEAVTRAFPVFLECYHAQDDAEARLYPGAAEAVEDLRRTGYATAICTNKPVDLAERLLVRLGVRELFGAVVGAGSLASRKPDPAPYRAAVARAGGELRRSFLLGDTETDRDTARAAGVACALVTFGPGGADMAALEPEGLLDGFAGLAGLTRRLIG